MEHAVDALNSCNDLTQEGYNKVLKLAAQELLSKTGKDLPTDKDAAVVKASFDAIGSVMVEAAKQDLDTDSLSTALEDCRLDSARADQLVSTYTKIRPSLREQLKKTGFSLPHIVDVDWRLDYFMKSNQLEKINEPCFHVSFKVEDAHNENNTVQLACNMAQMQDLVSKLKEASKRLETFS
eukprot:m.333046 g.333046  ORF g.333046 m.333046 type:complete len:181 (-) comp17054_c0_seq1:1068-1610(-)